MIKKSVFLLLFTILFAGISFSVGEDENNKLNVEDILKKIDEIYRSKSSYAEIEMQIVTPQWERTLTLDAWSLGMNKTFIRILSPKKEKGVATLRIADEMWNYLPKVNKVIKIPPSMMTGSWMGSDFTNDDLVKESTMLDDYTYRLIKRETGSADLLYIELKPKQDKPIVWNKIILSVDRKGYLPVSEEYYNEKGELVRSMNFGNVKKFGDRQIPSTIEIMPNKKEGHKTVIVYKKIDFDIPLSDDVFSLRNLYSGQ